MKYFTLLLLLFPLIVWGQTDKKEKQENNVTNELTIKSHTANIEGQSISYETQAGYLTIENDKGEPQANIFHIAYLKKGVSDPSKRPVLFSFNGGPGSSSVWLHLGVLGPQRIAMDSMGMAYGPPYRLETNAHSWLDEVDLVFIDPVMTGLSRPVPGIEKSNFTGLENDIKSVGEFIRRWITENKRWASPKIIAGESYGTTRAAGLSNYLQSAHGLYINGIVQVSAIMDFSTARFNVGNDKPYFLFLPTYTATAWYHRKLKPELQNLSLKEVLKKAEEFAMNEYAMALLKGDQLSSTEQNDIAQKLADLTGTSKDYILSTNLRPVIHDYTKELRRKERITVGRLDSRFTGIDRTAHGQRYENDPSYSAILGSFSGTLNDYLSRTLGYETKTKYNILTGAVHPWSYSTFENSYVNVAERLRRAMHNNPKLKVWIANGYFDLATPYFATKFTVDHMQLAPSIKSNISQTYYPAGHMMYIQQKSHKQMKTDFKNWLKTL